MPEKISFWAKKRVTKPVRVSFKTGKGKRVSFTMTKRFSKPVRVSFYAKKRRKSFLYR
jgi:hypothetical protein